MRNDTTAIAVVTIYFVTYLVLLGFASTRTYGLLMMLCAPLLLCWMVYCILKYGKHDGSELGKEEFGYQDRSKDQLGAM